MGATMNDDDNATLFGRLQPGDDALHVDVIRHHRDDHLLCSSVDIHEVDPTTVTFHLFG